MASEYLKDAQGRLIGRLDQRDGDTWAYNRKGELVGRYQHSNNQTVDNRGNRIGQGNQVQRTIKDYNDPSQH